MSNATHIKPYNSQIDFCEVSFSTNEMPQETHTHCIESSCPTVNFEQRLSYNTQPTLGCVLWFTMWLPYKGVYNGEMNNWGFTVVVIAYVEMFCMMERKHWNNHYWLQQYVRKDNW